MRLEFKVLVVEDHPEAMGEALGILGDHLAKKGFQLRVEYAQELSAVALRARARRGADLDLVMIDFNLGRTDIDGAIAAKSLRRQLPFTEMVFYSTDAEVDLHAELARNKVDGVFVAQRSAIPETLAGLADVVVGKAVDLNQMRGIAMAEVAELDAMASATVLRVVAAAHPAFSACTAQAMVRHYGDAEGHLRGIKKLFDASDAAKMFARVFPSSRKHQVLLAYAGLLPDPPVEALASYARFVDEVVQMRNALAHAVEEWSEDGALSLRSAQPGRKAVVVDEESMASFRNGLLRHRQALDEVCRAVEAFLDAEALPQHPAQG